MCTVQTYFWFEVSGACVLCRLTFGLRYQGRVYCDIVSKRPYLFQWHPVDTKLSAHTARNDRIITNCLKTYDDKN